MGKLVKKTTISNKPELTDALIYSDDKIVIPAEKIDNIIRNSFEKGYKTGSKFHFYNLWKSLLPASITLLLTLLTTTFNDFGTIKADILSVIVWVVFAIILLASVAFLAIALLLKGTDMTEERNKNIGIVKDEEGLSRK